MDLPHRPFGLAAQDWLVPAPAKIVVTSADGESKGGGEEGRGMSEHLQEEETRPCLTRIDENKERRDRPITEHTKHHPQLDPRPTIGSPRRAQRPQGAQTAEYIDCTRHAAESLNQPQDIAPQNLLNASPPTDHKTERRLADQPYVTESTSHQTIGCLPEKLLTSACQPTHAYKRIHQNIYQPSTSHQTIYQPSTSHQTIYQPSTVTSHLNIYQPSTSHKTSGCLPEKLLTRACQPTHAYKRIHQTIYQPSTSHQTICQPSISYQTIYQPSDHLDHIPRHIQLYCCHLKGEQCLMQKLHGHYTSLEPNSFRSRDDWPD